jgi:transposase InsO family protein
MAKNLTSSPPKLIRKFPFAHPWGFPSMSHVPTTSIVEDLEAALQQFAAIAQDLKNDRRPPPARRSFMRRRQAALAQFASAAYRQVLAQHSLLASMSRKGNCYDNAFIESFFSSLKYELVYHHRFATRALARTAIFDYIETFYNRTRLHFSLDYQSPIKFESKLN